MERRDSRTTSTGTPYAATVVRTYDKYVSKWAMLIFLVHPSDYSYAPAVVAYQSALPQR